MKPAVRLFTDSDLSVAAVRAAAEQFGVKADKLIVYAGSHQMAALADLKRELKCRVAALPREVLKHHSAWCAVHNLDVIWSSVE